MVWDYVGTMKGYAHIWWCEDLDGPELDIGPVAQAEGYHRLGKKIIWTDAACLIADLGLLVFLLYQLLSSGPYYFVRYAVTGYLIAVVLYMVVAAL